MNSLIQQEKANNLTILKSKSQKPQQFRINSGVRSNLLLKNNSASQVTQMKVLSDTNEKKKFQEFFENFCQTQGSTRYSYNINDSKYSELQHLRYLTMQQDKEIQDLKKQLSEISEFKIALDNNRNNQNTSELRVNALKAQIIQQKRFINKQSQTIRLFKKYQSDLNSILNWLKGKQLEKIQQDLKIKQHHELPIFQIPVEQQIQTLEQLEEKTKKNEVKKVLELPEQEKYNFIINFNKAYDKIKNQEQELNEYKRLFRQDNKGQLKYNYLLSNFISKYRQNFPIQTIFESFLLPEDKMTYEIFLTSAIQIQNKIYSNIKKLDSDILLKNNPFFLKSQNELAIQNQIEDFQNKNNQISQINLNYDQVMDVESSLNNLNIALTDFYKQSDQSQISIKNISSLQEIVSNCIGSVLNLGINLASQTKTIHLYAIQQQNENIKQASIQNNSSIHQNVKKDKTMDNSNKQNESKLFNESKFQNISKQHQEAYMLMQKIEQLNEIDTSQLFDELLEQVDNIQHKISEKDVVSDFQRNLHLLKIHFQKQEAITNVKSLQVESLKKIIYRFEKSITELNYFVDDMITCIKNYFSALQNENIEIANIAHQLTDKQGISQKQILSFVNKIKELITQQSNICNRIINPTKNNEFNINLKVLQTEFQEKLQTLSKNWFLTISV